MAFEHNVIQQLKQEIFDEADKRYVQISNCNEKQASVNKMLADDDKRIDLILQEQKQMRQEMKSGLKLNNWLTAGVLGAIITAFVGFYFFFS